MKNRLLHPYFFALLLITTLPIAAQQEEEDIIRIEYRTLGWNGYFGVKLKSDTYTVFPASFSKPKTYSGTRTLQFFKDENMVVDRGDAESAAYFADQSQEFDDDSNSATPTPATQSSPKQEEALIPFAQVRIPEGMKKVLLIFIGGEQGKPNRIIPMDDSLTKTDTRNVQFYNLSPIPLVVKAFDTIKQVPPRKQAIWELTSTDRVSPLMIAVTEPEDKLVYSTSFGVRKGQRIVFFARDRKSVV